MTTLPTTSDEDHENACPSGLCDQIDDCDACSGTGDDPSGLDDCEECWGRGEVVPDHCCACGGSPYCQCCPNCGAGYLGKCECPVAVTLADGTVMPLPPASEPEWEPKFERAAYREDDPDPEPPDYDEDDRHEPQGGAEPVGGYSSEPPF
ncbi:hypothetical protein [Streptomyces sp. NPDC001404]|uniref:hypothetical protein n=1 Tax=Streptomyces sp. NPDC001404 TaxID=3364571 RepID=UPI0036B3959B